MRVSNLLGILFVSAFAFSTCAVAVDVAREGGGGGDSTRERGDSSDRGARGEMNHDNDTQSAEGISNSKRSGGHAVTSLRHGEPTDPNYSYNKNKQEMKGHD